MCSRSLSSGGHPSVEGTPSLKMHSRPAEPHQTVCNEPRPDAGTEPGKQMVCVHYLLSELATQVEPTNSFHAI